MNERTEQLRATLEKHIGGVYKKALASTGNPETAREVTRRVMALLRRTHETGLSITDDTVRRLTDDCCREMAYYDQQKAIFRDGVIAGAPDFDAAISALSKEEVQAAMDRERAEAEAAAHARERTAAERAAQRAAAEAEAIAAMEERAERERAAADAIARAINEASPIRPRPEGRRQPVPNLFDLEEDEEEEDEDFGIPEEDEEDGDYNGEEYEDEDEDDGDYPDERRGHGRDKEPQPAHGREKKQPAMPLILLSLLAVVLAGLVFLLLMMLISRGVLPGGESGFVQGFVRWFNESLFPLF